MAENADRAQALLALETAVAAQAAVADQLGTAVAQARRAGITWTDIAVVLGLSRSTAFYRFQHLDERT